MALVGQPLLGRIVAHKAGHALHTQLVTRLLADRSLWKETTAEHAPAIRYRARLRSRSLSAPKQTEAPTHKIGKVLDCQRRYRARQ